MVMQKRVLITLLALASMMLGQGALSEVLGYSYIAVDGTTKKQSPDNKYMNPDNTLNVMISAGIDRKISLKLISKSGSTYADIMSDRVGYEDRVSYNGQQYYGMAANLSVPEDGEYHLLVKTIDMQGKATSSGSYDLLIDRKAPELIGEVQCDSFAGLGCSVDYFGRGAARYYFEGYVEENGIATSKVHIKNLISGAVEVRDLDLTSGGEVTLNTLKGYVYGVFKDKTPYTLTYKLTDKAGNEGSFVQSVYADTKVPSVDFGQIYDTATGTWKNYVPGMMVYDNPVKVRLVTDITSIAEHNPKGAGINNAYDLEIIGNKAYFMPAGPNSNTFIATYPAEASGRNYWRLKTVGGAYKDFKPAQLNLNFAGNIKKAPIGAETLEPAPLMFRFMYRNSDGNFSGDNVFEAPKTISEGRSFLDAGRFSIHHRSKEFIINTVQANIKEPVDYNVRAEITLNRKSYGGEDYFDKHYCTIYRGQTSCTEGVYIEAKMDNFPKGGGFISGSVVFDEEAIKTHKNGYTYKAMAGTFPRAVMHVHQIGIDFSSAYAEAAGLDTDKKTVSANIIESQDYDLTTSASWRFGFEDYAIYAINDSGVKTELNIISESNIDRYSRRITASYDSLPGGEYALFAFVRDKYGRETAEGVGNIKHDKTPPTVTLNGESEVYTLDDMSIRVVDEVDNTPTVISVNLKGGPTNEDVNIAVSRRGSNEWKLEYPVLFPSLRDDESYILTVTAEDDSGNRAAEELEFFYRPTEVTLDGTFDGEYLIPPVNHAFSRGDGSPIFSTDILRDYAGRPVESKHDVFATLDIDSEVAMVVNGKGLLPGNTKKIWSKYDFDASGGTFAVDVHPYQPNKHGKSKLILTTTAPNSPVIIANLNVWKPDVKLSSDTDWTFRQLLDPVRAQISSLRASQCVVTTDEDLSRGSTPFHPICLLEWDELPGELESTILLKDGFETHGVSGRLTEVGEQTIKYRLSMFDVDGSKHQVGAFSQVLKGIPATTKHNLTMDREPISIEVDQKEPFARAVTPIKVTLSQTAGPACPVTLSKPQGLSSAYSGVGLRPLICHFEWTEIPEGLEQSNTAYTPELQGYIKSLGEFKLGWKLFAYTEAGDPILVSKQDAFIYTKDPEKPEVTLSSKYHWKDDKFVVPFDNKYVGILKGTQDVAAINLSLFKNDYSLGNKTFEPTGASTSSITMPVPLQQSALWKEEIYKADVSYKLLPEVYTNETYKVYSAPSASIVPVLQMAEKEALNNQLFDVGVAVRDRRKIDQPYNSDTMGAWQAALFSVDRAGETALTDYKGVNQETGNATFGLDFSEFESSYMRLRAKIKSVNPIGYEKEVSAFQDIYVSVLRAHPIEGDIKVKKISGVEPLRARFSIALDNIADRTATEKVEWTIHKNGKHLETVDSTGRSKLYLTRNFSEGVYRVKAKITNIHSGAVSYADEIEVVAYKMLDVKIDSVGTTFVDSPTTLKALVTDKKTGIPFTDAIYEWSDDNGATYKRMGSTLTVNSSEVGTKKVRLRVKPATAPEEDAYSWKSTLKYVSFKEVRPPRAYPRGPSRVETGKTYKFTARLSTPYSKMDKVPEGEFVFPDGSVVRGLEASYTIREEDLEGGKMKVLYRSWIRGYENKGGAREDAISARVWKYTWPEFRLSTSHRTNQAPSKVTAYIVPKGPKSHLENLQYIWQLPPGAVVSYDRASNKRVFTLNKAGEHTVRVVVSDGRGYQTVYEDVLTIREPEPFEVVLKPYKSNRYGREPLTFTVRTYISGGHPEDKSSQHSFFVNGEALSVEGTRPSFELMAGQHELTYKGVSKMGVKFEHSIPLEVKENKKPVCELLVRETVPSWYFTAACKDEDGKIVSNAWTVDGDKKSVSSYRLSLNKERDENGAYLPAPVVTHQATDDAGAKSGIITNKP